MIQEVMDQRVRASPVSMGYSQQIFHPCGPVAPQWGPPPYGLVQNPCYDSRQRGPYPSPSAQQHPAPVYGSYPSHQPPPRSGFGPSWEHRLPSPMQQGPPPPQANYNYGQPQPFYQQHQPQPHGQSYGYPGQMPPPTMPQQMAAYPLGGFTGDQYGKPPSYGLIMQQQTQASHAQQQHYSQQPQASHVQQQHYSQQLPRGGSQSAEVLPIYMASSHGYGVNMQQYPYPSTGGPMQQAYLAGTPCGPAAPSGDGYSQHPQQLSSGPVYPQQQQQPPAAYAQTGQQPPVATTYASSYPSQPPADNSVAGYGYQAQAPPADPYVGSSISHQCTAATYNAQPCYAQVPPPATHTGYDQSVAQSGGYVVTQPTTQAAAATGYGSSA